MHFYPGGKILLFVNKFNLLVELETSKLGGCWDGKRESPLTYVRGIRISLCGGGCGEWRVVFYRPIET